MTEHDHWDELAAGYALHGLAPDEEVLFLDHLATCDECIASLGDHEMVAAQLGSIAHYREKDEVAPSWDAMRSLVLGSAEDAPEIDPEFLAEAAALAKTSNLVDLDARRRRYTTSRRALAAAAAVVVVAGGGVATWRMTSNNGTSTPTTNASCSAAAGCHTLELASKGADVANLIVRGDRATITPTAMAKAPAGEVYVLWQVPRDAKATPIGKFRGGTGTGAKTRTLNVAYSDTQQFAVSLESAVGAPPAAPTNSVAVSGATA